MCKTDLEREFIREQIRKLDRIFVPQKAQREGVLAVYQAKPEKIEAVGMGYNSQIFHGGEEKKDDGVTRIVFAGKIAEKKGVMSLIRSLSVLYSQKARACVMSFLYNLQGVQGIRRNMGRSGRWRKNALMKSAFWAGCPSRSLQGCTVRAIFLCFHPFSTGCRLRS